VVSVGIGHAFALSCKVCPSPYGLPILTLYRGEQLLSLRFPGDHYLQGLDIGSDTIYNPVASKNFIDLLR
jgi:hypothetical protein